MTLYREDKDGKFEYVGCVEACSILDLNGPSYVHITMSERERFGLPNEPYDWFFDTYDEALDWAYEQIR